jgi:hypothetical protein
MPPWASGSGAASNDPKDPNPGNPQAGDKRARSGSPSDAPTATKKSKRSRGKAKAKPPQFHLKKDDIPLHLQGAKVRGSLLCSLSIFLTARIEFNLPSWRYPLWHMLLGRSATNAHSRSFCFLRRTLCGGISLQTQGQPSS